MNEFYAAIFSGFICFGFGVWITHSFDSQTIENIKQAHELENTKFIKQLGELESERKSVVIVAQDASNKRVSRIVSDSNNLRSERDRLRDALTAYPGCDKTTPASVDRTDTLKLIFEQLANSAEDLARKADSHVNDLQTCLDRGK